MSVSRRTTKVGTEAGQRKIVVWMAGEIDTAREGELLDAVVSLDVSPGSTVELDVSQVTFVDSRGLTGILRAKAYLSGRECMLVVRHPQNQLVRVIEMSGLTDVLTVKDGNR
jgi:anti-sigma B factor antagonist